MKKNSIVKDSSVSTTEEDNELFISPSDMARNKNPEEAKDVVKNWMRSWTTIEFSGIWEQLNNPDFKGGEFDSLLFEAGSKSFSLSPQYYHQKHPTSIRIVKCMTTKILS